MWFVIEIVSSGYCCDVDMWLTLSTKMSFSIYTCWLFWFIGEKNISQLQKIFCNYTCSFQLYF